MKCSFEVNRYMTYSDVLSRINKHKDYTVTELRIDISYIKYNLINADGKKYYIMIYLADYMSNVYPKIKNISIVCDDENFIKEFKEEWI